jgi:hypothetical protein
MYISYIYRPTQVPNEFTWGIYATTSFFFFFFFFSHTVDCLLFFLLFFFSCPPPPPHSRSSPPGLDSEGSYTLATLCIDVCFVDCEDERERARGSRRRRRSSRCIAATKCVDVLLYHAVYIYARGSSQWQVQLNQNRQTSVMLATLTRRLF